MAKRRKKQGLRPSAVTAVLVLAVTVYCVLLSWDAKHGGTGLALPVIQLPETDFFQELLDGREPQEPVATGNLPGAKLSVHFLDVGQAESILIRGPKADVLLDAGENDAGEEVLRYLKRAGVNKLAHVIGTHPHADHIGGLDTVLLGMPVERVILPALPESITPTTQTYTDLLQAIAKQGLTVTPAAPGKSYDLGDGATLTILGPVAEYSDLNNMSVVCRLVYGETSFLLAADAEIPAENDILARGDILRANMLSVGHHGSDTATGDAFLDRVSPRLAVISCGIDNSYGHPHKALIERLEARGVRILRTDQNGAVVIASDGKRLSAETER